MALGRSRMPGWLRTLPQWRLPNGNLRPAPAKSRLRRRWTECISPTGALTIPGTEAYIRVLGAPPLGAMVRCEAPTDYSVTSVRLCRMRRLQRLVRTLTSPARGRDGWRTRGRKVPGCLTSESEERETWTAEVLAGRFLERRRLRLLPQECGREETSAVDVSGQHYDRDGEQSPERTEWDLVKGEANWIASFCIAVRNVIGREKFSSNLRV